MAAATLMRPTACTKQMHLCRSREKQTNSPRHSAAMRSIEPGIHNPRPWLWIPGLRPKAHPRCAIAHRGMTRRKVFSCRCHTVIASAAKQSSFDPLEPNGKSGVFARPCCPECHSSLSLYASCWLSAHLSSPFSLFESRPVAWLFASKLRARLAVIPNRSRRIVILAGPFLREAVQHTVSRFRRRSEIHPVSACQVRLAAGCLHSTPTSFRFSSAKISLNAIAVDLIRQSATVLHVGKGVRHGAR
jgi:hypothetical protein